MTDDRRCTAGHLCRGYTVTDGRRTPALLEQQHGLCDPCQRWVRSALRQLPGDWCKLNLTLGEPSRSVKSGGRRPKPGSRVPINVGADELMRQIVIASWDAGALVAAELNTRWPWIRQTRSSVHDYQLLVAAERLASPNVGSLISDPAGIGVALLITHLHRRVTQQIGETRQRERQHLPCPSCGAQALVKEVQDRRGLVSAGDGTATPEVIRCLSCDGGPNRDGTWTEAEYQWLAQMVLSEREEHNVLKWLLAEAQHERDVASWLASERHWVLGKFAQSLGYADATEIIENTRKVFA